MLDVLDPEVQVPITEMDLVLFEQALRSVEVTAGFVIDQMRKEEAERAELLHTQISQALHPFVEATQKDVQDFQKKYKNLLGDHERIKPAPQPEPETVIISLWEEPKPSLARRFWNWIWSKSDD